MRCYTTDALGTEGGILLGGVDDAHETGMNWATLEASLPRSRYRAFRVGFDRLAGLLLCTAGFPLLLLISLLIRLDSRGPAFFRQRRVGRFAKPFTIIKFRTMSTGAPRWSLKVGDDNPNITWVGGILRRTGLDELPQLLNVIRGEMALIGPRPEQIALMSLYEPWQQERHLLRPGITGWWQIHHRDNSPLHLNVDKDIYYVRHQSLRLDLEIVMGTAKVLVSPLRHWVDRLFTTPALHPNRQPPLMPTDTTSTSAAVEGQPYASGAAD